jgi:hypothetical protein
MSKVEELTNRLIDTMATASLRWHTVECKVKNKYIPGGIIPFSGIFNDDNATFIVYASSYANAQDQINQYLGEYLYK